MTTHEQLEHNTSASPSSQNNVTEQSVQHLIYSTEDLYNPQRVRFKRLCISVW